MSRQPQLLPPGAWGQPLRPQDNTGRGYAQPLLATWRAVRAQIGGRPVQATTPGSAGQSATQRGGIGARSGPVDETSAYFNYGEPPCQIQRFFRTANTGYSGVNSVGRSTIGNLSPDGDNSTVIRRPLQRFPTRGARSISGAFNGKSRWDDTGRAPTVFVPTAPYR